MATVNINHLTVHYEKLQVPADLHQLTKIAELTVEPQLIPNEIKRVRGSVQVYTLPAPNVGEPTLDIPFRTTVLHGSLDYDRTASYFYIPSSSIDSTNDNKEECRAIKLLNRFNTSVVIYSVTTDKTELLSQYIQVNCFVENLFLKSIEFDFYFIAEYSFTLYICKSRSDSFSSMHQCY